MENIPDNIIFKIATFLPVHSILNLALTCKRFLWLIDDNLLFKYLFKRDFDLDSSVIRNPHKRLLPDWQNRQKYVYKIVKYLETEIKLSVKMQERRSMITVHTFFEQNEDEDINIFDNIICCPFITNEGIIGIHDKRDTLKISHLHIKQKIRKAEYKHTGHKYKHVSQKYTKTVVFEICIVQEGLVVWENNRSKYFLVFPTNLLNKLALKYYKPGNYDGSIRTEEYKKNNPHISDRGQILRGVDRTKIETNCFGFNKRYYIQ